jgi:uncharacterized protein YggT (Ycf19 family)
MRSEIIETEHFVREPRPGRAVGVARVGRVIDYLFGIVYTLLLVRLVLEFFGARPSGFVQIMHSLTDPFYAPFRGIFPTLDVNGAHLVWPLVVAILVYMVLHAGIRGLLHLIARA